MFVSLDYTLKPYNNDFDKVIALFHFYRVKDMAINGLFLAKFYTYPL